jgi:hypothetical protein
MIDPRYASLVHEWAGEISRTIGRSVKEIRERGLNALDFPHQEIDIQFEDGSHARFRFAFAVDSPDKKAVAVFTEHCGYFVLPRAGLLVTVVSRNQK